MPKPDYRWLEEAWKVCRNIGESQGPAARHAEMARRLSGFAFHRMGPDSTRSTIITVLSEFAQYLDTQTDKPTGDLAEHPAESTIEDEFKVCPFCRTPTRRIHCHAGLQWDVCVMCDTCHVLLAFLRTHGPHRRKELADASPRRGARHEVDKTRA